MQPKKNPATHKNAFYAWLNISLDSGDEGQNWDTVMFLVTTFEMILTGLKRKPLFSYCILELTLLHF